MCGAFRWVDRTPMIVEYFESILPFVGNKEQYGHTQKDALPSMQKYDLYYVCEALCVCRMSLSSRV